MFFQDMDKGWRGTLGFIHLFTQQTFLVAAYYVLELKLQQEARQWWIPPLMKDIKQIIHLIFKLIQKNFKIYTKIARIAFFSIPFENMFIYAMPLYH